MNKDGYVNSIDASLILSYYANKATSWTDSKQEKIIACDVTGDHVVSRSDYEMIKAMVRLGKYNAKYDLNSDNVLDQKDITFYLEVLKEYGTR